MAHIRIIESGEAKGLLKKEYDAAVRRAGRVFNVLKIMSQNPKALQASMRFYLEVMHGESPLSRGQREMLAVVVSKANRCFY
jgi:uncharacterized peroxidase-related enzyme